MARIGAFDETGLPIAWWSDVGSPNGWVTDELLEGGGSPQTQPVTAATSTETANDVTPVPVVPVGAAFSSEAAGSITAVRYQATPDRVFRVAVEARTLVLLYRVVEVLRTMTTALETRTLTVQAQTRTADTLSEGRTLTVGAESRTELAEGE